MLGMARNEASCSMGWCGGPSSPTPIESCVKMEIAGISINAPRRKMVVRAVRQLAALHPVQWIDELGKLFLVLLEFCLPCRASLGSALAHAVLELVIHSIGDKKLRIGRPAIILFYQFDFRFAQWLAMRFFGILFVGRSIADVAVHHVERRPALRF